MVVDVEVVVELEVVEVEMVVVDVEVVFNDFQLRIQINCVTFNSLLILDMNSNFQLKHSSVVEVVVVVVVVTTHVLFSYSWIWHHNSHNRSPSS